MRGFFLRWAPFFGYVLLRPNYYDHMMRMKGNGYRMRIVLRYSRFWRTWVFKRINYAYAPRVSQ